MHSEMTSWVADPRYALVHRLAASFHAPSPYSATLMQSRFASFAVINLQ